MKEYVPVFIPKEIADKMLMFGFDFGPQGVYNTETSAFYSSCTLDRFLDWLRDEYKMVLIAYPEYSFQGWKWRIYQEGNDNGSWAIPDNIFQTSSEEKFSTYEKAIFDGAQHAIWKIERIRHFKKELYENLPTKL